MLGCTRNFHFIDIFWLSVPAKYSPFSFFWSRRLAMFYDGKLCEDSWQRYLNILIFFRYQSWHTHNLISDFQNAIVITFFTRNFPFHFIKYDGSFKKGSVCIWMQCIFSIRISTMYYVKVNRKATKNYGMVSPLWWDSFKKHRYKILINDVLPRKENIQYGKSNL